MAPLVTDHGPAVQREADGGHDDSILFKVVVASDSQTLAVFCNEAGSKEVAEDRYGVDSPPTGGIGTIYILGF